MKCYNKGGTPQGGQISPILANVYLHYVLDQWFEIVLKKYARGGKYRLGVRASKKKLKMKKQTVKAWLVTRLTKPVADTMRLINLSLAGHYNYYGVSGNFHAIQGFWKYVKYATYRMLNRRDQKGKFRYTKFLRVWKYYVKKPHLTTDIWNWKPMLV